MYGASDKPDVRDFLAGNVLKDVSTEIRSVDLKKNWKAQDQGSVPACTCFGSLVACSLMNTMEHEELIYLDPLRLWEKMLELGLASEKGATLQNALKTLLKYNINEYPIEGYAKVAKDFDSFAIELNNKRPIFTGMIVTNINWDIAKRTGYLTNVGKQTWGHAFFISGCDVDTRELIATNSWDETWGAFGDGTFRIKEEEIENLFTSYIIYDKKDMKTEMLFKDVPMDHERIEDIQFCVDKGLFKGKDSDKIPEMKDRIFGLEESITRVDMATLIRRVLELKG